MGIENLEHGAIFPEEICVNPIMSTSREDDLVANTGSIQEVKVVNESWDPVYVTSTD